MTFLRQKYKIKPQAWGPVSEVQASLFKNAERIGIDPESIGFFCPWFLNPIDYISGDKAVLYGSAAYQSDDSIKTTGNTGYFEFPNIKKEYFWEYFTFTLVCSIADINQIAGAAVGNICTYNSGFSCNFEEYNNTGKYGISAGSVADQPTTLSPTLNRIQSITWRYKDGDIFYINENQNQVSHSAASINNSNVINGLTFCAKNRGTIYDKANASIYFITGFKKVLSDNQVNFLHDNPYQLLHRIPPVVYFIPITAAPGAISLLANLTNATATSDVTQTIDRSINAALANSTNTLDVSQTITRDLTGMLSNATATTDINKTIIRDLTATLTNATNTTDIAVAISGMISLVVNLTNATSTTDITQTITRDISANLTNATATTDINVILGNVISLICSLTNQTSTTDLNVLKIRDLSATLQNATSTTDIQKTITRLLSANLTNQSATTDIKVLLGALLILASDLLSLKINQDSLTAQMSQDSLTAKIDQDDLNVTIN